jgi:predicted nucleic acid-binding protein
MTPPTVLLDRSFLAALVDPAHEHAAEATERYAELVGRYWDHEIRLRARHDHLGEVSPELRRTLLAPVERISVARQFRRQAARLDLPFEVDPDVAVTLVVMRRETIDRIATFDETFERIWLRALV